MKITINRELLLGPLQIVTNVVERRQALPILSNILFVADRESLVISATDMEVEMVIRLDASATVDIAGAITLPARKFIDIWRSLPADADVSVETKDNKASVKCGRSRFSLATLPAQDYPNLGDLHPQVSLTLKTTALRRIIAETQFAMAHQDVRYYLNGLLIELSGNRVRAVATDGHRLALSDVLIDSGIKETLQVIVPRKGITEAMRLLGDQGQDGEVQLEISQSHLRIRAGNYQLTTKLIDGKFPDYMRVLPAKGDKIVVADRETLKHGLARTSILSNEKFRGVRLTLQNNHIQALAHNPDQEEAEESIDVAYTGQELEIGFNVVYLLDVLSVLGEEKVQLEFSTPEKSCLIFGQGNSDSKYVIMPMRL